MNRELKPEPRDLKKCASVGCENDMPALNYTGLPTLGTSHYGVLCPACNIDDIQADYRKRFPPPSPDEVEPIAIAFIPDLAAEGVAIADILAVLSKLEGPSVHRVLATVNKHVPQPNRIDLMEGFFGTGPGPEDDEEGPSAP